MTRRRKRVVDNRTERVDLGAMIEQATVDAYGESEQATGLYTMLEEHLELPFETKVFGVAVSVTRLELEGDNRIVAICSRGRARQAIQLHDLPLPSPRPAGAEWIEAYRCWLAHQ